MKCTGKNCPLEFGKVEKCTIHNCEHRTKPTNFDKITESVYSFIEWVDKNYKFIPDCVPCLPIEECGKEHKCKECLKAWLQKECD